MGKPLTQQRRGKGGPPFLSPGHRFVSPGHYPAISGTQRGEVIELIQDPSKDVLLARVLLEDGRQMYMLAPEGMAIGDSLQLGEDAQPRLGNVVPLKNMPDGTPIFNVELRPMDGGKIARCSGTYGVVSSHDEITGKVEVRFATGSKEIKIMLPECRATIGVACGGGRPEKPFKKASNKRFKMEAMNRYYPKVRGTAMSAYDHPHGGKSLGKSNTVSRNAPPGRKVGLVAARRSGRRRRREEVSG
ncbi:MAG: 50S ribosomal protein L2 [Candidatus Micrarchaeota archaeon]